MTITREEMTNLDKRAIEGYGIDSLLLMENAGVKVFEEIKDKNSFTVICGRGNNGGDGLVVARHLIVSEKEVDTFIIKGPKSEESKHNYNILKNLTDRVYIIEKEEDLEKLEKSIKENVVVIDSIFGIGTDREIKGIYRDVIELVNKYDNYTVAVDIPSGIDANTGQSLGVNIKADKTVTIHEKKIGMDKNEDCGEIVEVYIGIPKWS